MDPPRPRRTLRRSAWYAASARLHAGEELTAREKAVLRRRGMLHEECSLSGRGRAAYAAARLGVPVLEARILAVLYAFRGRIGSASPVSPAPLPQPAPGGGASPASPEPAPLPPGVPVSYSALLPLLAGRSQSRLRSAVACLVGRGLAAKRGRELVCITEEAFERLSDLGPQLLAIEALR